MWNLLTQRPSPGVKWYLNVELPLAAVGAKKDEIAEESTIIRAAYARREIPQKIE